MNDAIADRIRGTILASACANSLGGPCVGMSRKEISFAGGVYGLHNFMPGMPRSMLPEYKPGQLLSDTLFALKVAESLIATKGIFSASDLKQRLADLLSDEDFLNCTLGAHCLLPLRQMCEESDAANSESGADSSHVSTAARAYPIGLLPPGAEVVTMAVAQAELSHPDRRLAAASAVLAHAVKEFVSGTRLDDANQVRNFVKQHFDIAQKIDARFADYWDDVAPDLDYMHPATELPYSLINVDPDVNEAIPTAVGIFLIFRHDLEEGVAAAASCGGDTDTVAAIVGALSGAYHGASAIPEHWLKQISQRDRLEKIADELIGLWK